MTDSADGKLITWDGLTFSKAGAKFTMTIKNVDIEENGDSLAWTTRIGAAGELDDNDLLNESPVLYITDTTTDAVVFTMGDGSSFASF